MGDADTVMIWVNGERVQTADALLFDQRPQSSELLAHFKAKPKAFLDCDYAFGENWAALFANTIDGEAILPNLPNTRPIYQAYERIFLPVGVSLSLSKTAAFDYLQAILDRHVPQHQDVIIVPDNRTDAPQAALYVIEERLPIGLIIPRDAA